MGFFDCTEAVLMMAPPSGHQRHRQAHQVEDRMHVGVEGLAPLVQGNVVEAFEVFLVAGVIDQNIQPAQSAVDLVDQRRCLAGVADVAPNEQRLDAGLFDQCANACRVFLLVGKKGNRDIGAFACIGKGYRSANAAYRRR